MDFKKEYTFNKGMVLQSHSKAILKLNNIRIPGIKNVAHRLVELVVAVMFYI